MNRRVTTLGLVGALAALAPLTAAPAQAATGGKTVANPGVVSLTSDTGEHQCSAVRVAPDWALTWSDTARCGKADTVTDPAGEHATITEHRYWHVSGGPTPNAPTKSQAMLVHLSKPLHHVAPAKLDPRAPKAGEKLSIVAFNGPEGAAHTSTLGRSAVTIDGHNRWISWFDAPSSLELEHSDAGALLMRGDKVVGFLGLAESTGGDAEDIANVYQWVNKVALRP